MQEYQKNVISALEGQDKMSTVPLSTIFPEHQHERTMPTEGKHEAQQWAADNYIFMCIAEDYIALEKYSDNVIARAKFYDANADQIHALRQSDFMFDYAFSNGCFNNEPVTYFQALLDRYSK